MNVISNYQFKTIRKNINPEYKNENARVFYTIAFKGIKPTSTSNIILDTIITSLATAATLLTTKQNSVKADNNTEHSYKIIAKAREIQELQEKVNKISNEEIRDLVNRTIKENNDIEINRFEELKDFVDAYNALEGHYSLLYKLTNSEEKAEIVQIDKAVKKQFGKNFDLLDVGKLSGGDKTVTKDIAAEYKKEPLREFLMKYPNSELSNILYDKYLDERYAKLEPETKAHYTKILKNIQNKYGTKILLSERMAMNNFDTYMDYIVEEFDLWDKASKGKAKKLDVLEFSTTAIINTLTGEASAYKSLKYSYIVLDYANEKSLKKSLRHELAHLNDSLAGNRPQKMKDFFENKITCYEKDAYGNILKDEFNRPIVNAAECKFVEDFTRANIKSSDIEYAYTTIEELLAVMVEFHMHPSAEFKKVCVEELGFPDWIFDIPINSKTNKLGYSRTPKGERFEIGKHKSYKDCEIVYF